MRVDKFLTTVGAASRSEAAKAAKRGEILVNGVVIKKADMHIDPEKDELVFRGEELTYKRFVYVMLNKPDGYVSATDDAREKTVLELLPEKYQRLGLFPCGRLDKNTIGLIILTNDGEGAHRVLSPKRHVSKVYRYECADPLTEEDVSRLSNGITLEDGYVTKDAEIKAYDAFRGEITLTEGKYHQIKRMFGAVGNKITYLERIRFGSIVLDTALKRGEWRELTENEAALFENT